MLLDFTGLKAGMLPCTGQPSTAKHDPALHERPRLLRTKFKVPELQSFKPPGPITLWEIDGETVETVADFIFLGSKITADGDCSHEIKRHLLLGRKVMTNLDSRDNTLPIKVRLVKAMVFPVVMMDVRVGL